MTELNLQCPWCGAKNVSAMAYLNKANFKMWKGKCLNCGVTGPPKDDARTALEAWNQRGEVKVPEPPRQTPGAPLKGPWPLSKLNRVRAKMDQILDRNTNWLREDLEAKLHELIEVVRGE